MKRAECSGRNIGKVFSPFSSWYRRTLYRSCNSQLRSPTSLSTSPSAPQPQVVTTQPTYTVVNYQPPPTTKLPLYALVTSLIVTIVFAGFCCFVPGLLCLIPAVSTAICVSLQQSILD